MLESKQVTTQGLYTSGKCQEKNVQGQGVREFYDVSGKNEILQKKCQKCQ